MSSSDGVAVRYVLPVLFCTELVNVSDKGFVHDNVYMKFCSVIYELTYTNNHIGCKII